MEDISAGKNVTTNGVQQENGRLYIEKAEKQALFSYLTVKRGFDIVASAVAIVVFCPLLAVIAILVRMTSPGPAIYKQERVGKGGKPFFIYKFRSMVDGADHLSKFLSPNLWKKYLKERKLENDPRITKFGAFLRKTSLDETPQIFNIFKGNMSIVGPRPMLPDEINLYGRSYKYYTKMKPGLTGLWQIHCRDHTDMRARARLDACYIWNQSFKLDFWIFIQTFKAVFLKKGAR